VAWVVGIVIGLKRIMGRRIGIESARASTRGLVAGGFLRLPVSDVSDLID
jgi:hypothetical protein